MRLKILQKNIRGKRKRNKIPGNKRGKISVAIFLIAMVGIVLLGAVKSLVPVFADETSLPLTSVIEIFMLVAAALMVLLTKQTVTSFWISQYFVQVCLQ